MHKDTRTPPSEEHYDIFLFKLARVLAIPILSLTLAGCIPTNEKKLPPTETPIASWKPQEEVHVSSQNVINFLVPVGQSGDLAVYSIYFGPFGPDGGSLPCHSNPPQSTDGQSVTFRCGDIDLFKYTVTGRDVGSHANTYVVTPLYPAEQFSQPPVHVGGE